MSKKATYLLGILLTIIVGTLLYCKLCCNCCDKAVIAEDNQEEVTPNDSDRTKIATTLPFMVKDANGDFSFSINDNFNFNTSEFSIVKPLSENLNSGIDKLGNYLSNNSFKNINITGLYTSSEKNTSAFPNLGLARANAIKNYFISKGFSSKQMNLFGLLNDNLIPDGTLFKGPLNFNILTLDDTSSKDEGAKLKLLGDSIKANPLILHFATGQNAINLTSEQRQKVADIVRYLDKVEGSNSNVVGHTDNTGNRDANIGLGQERADFAKNYLVRNGLSENKIVATSKGPDQPIADNNTEEGKAKNRRTVVTIN